MLENIIKNLKKEMNENPQDYCVSTSIEINKENCTYRFVGEILKGIKNILGGSTCWNIYRTEDYKYILGLIYTRK